MTNIEMIKTKIEEMGYAESYTDQDDNYTRGILEGLSAAMDANLTVGAAANALIKAQRYNY